MTQSTRSSNLTRNLRTGSERAISARPLLPPPNVGFGGLWSYKRPMSATAFTKMHGLGNDFVVLDARARPIVLDTAQVRALADRHAGIGCDQVIVLESASGGVFMRIFNADGGEVEACGNAARCVAAMLMAEAGSNDVSFATGAGTMVCRAADGDRVMVDIGPVRTGWRDIPLAREADTEHLPLDAGGLSDACAVNVGNPHAIFFVGDVDAIDLATLGPKLETDPLFPERANITVCKVLGPGEVRIKVWERGAGLTRACGTAACAAIVAAHTRGLMARDGVVHLPGGDLQVTWREDGHVEMTGPTATSFAGTVEIADLMRGAA
jgi:diaminopimelate epimerase